MRHIFIFLFLLSSYSHAQQLILTRPGAGGIDTSNPVVTLSSNDPDPIVGAGTITVLINFSKPVIGFTQSDITVTNSTITSFTALTQANYSIVADPAADGVFTFKVNASTCTDTRGIANLASNTLSYTLEGGGGIDYDLENATQVAAQLHYRGHAASFTDCNDLLSTINVSGMELLYTKNNLSCTQMASGDNQFGRDMFHFGRCDFGLISLDTANFRVIRALITSLRDGHPTTVMSYKNGVYSYAQYTRDRVLYGRNSGYEAVFNPLPIAYTGLTDVTMNARAVTFRDDYYAKAGSTYYYRGDQATGDTRLASYVSQVLAANGWYTNFVHWHWQVADYPDHYISKLWENIGSADVYTGSVNSVVEYYFVRESVTSISCLDDAITVNHTKDWPSSPYSSIQTPVWIKINVSGTNLAGREISATSGLRVRKLATDIFIVPIMLNFNASSTTATIYVTDNPSYVNLNQPVINISGASVTTDQPCRFTVFRINKPTSLGTSTDSRAIPTVDNTTVNMTTQTGLAITVDMTVRVKNDASHYFYATVLSYNSGTGAISLSSSNTGVGTGTFASWTIDRYYHMISATVLERSYTFTSAYTITSAMNDVTYDYWVGAINEDLISNAGKKP